MSRSETRTISKDIDATPADVWEVLVDLTTLPEISPSTVEVAGRTELTAVDDEFEQTVKLAGRRFTSTWRVTEFEPERRIAVAGSVLPGTKYSMTQELRERPDGGSTLSVTIAYSLPLGVVGRLAGRLGAEKKALGEAEEVLEGIASIAERSATSRRSRS